MKKMLLMPLIFFSIIMNAYAVELYVCVDDKGKEIITSVPQDSMTCVLKESIAEPAPEQIAEKAKADKSGEEASKNKPAGKTQKERVIIIQKCIDCCGDKFNNCYSYTANNKICNAIDEKCVAMCNAEGASTSEWGECWTGK